MNGKSLSVTLEVQTMLKRHVAVLINSTVLSLFDIPINVSEPTQSPATTRFLAFDSNLGAFYDLSQCELSIVAPTQAIF